MLTVDHVSAFRRGERLFIRKLDKNARVRALEIGAAYLDIAQSSIGLPREEFEEGCAAVSVRASDRKLAAGLRKLVTDRCEFEMSEEIAPSALRERVFMEASRIRQTVSRHSDFNREAVLSDAGSFFNLDAESVDRLLYADLKSAHRLASFAALTPTQLVSQYERSQGQAVLLKATRVRITVRAETADAYRRLFFKLKFLGLLHTIHRIPGGGYSIDIEGPFNMFQSVTKYGLNLALLVPAVEACGKWTLDAEILWGKERQKLSFRMEGTETPEGDLPEAPRLPDPVAQLLVQFAGLDCPWEATPSTDILELPGEGLCVPDLQFIHRTTGETVYLEVMGFWSRNAVWKRIELVQAGLPFQIIFAVSKNLRVSEQVLADTLPACLYVYKTKMNARRIYEILDRRCAAG